MATIHPVALVVGVVREVVPNEFVNRETGVVENRGRKVTVLTRAGFAQFNVPVEHQRVPFDTGDEVAVWVRIASWQMNGRSGTTLVLDSLPAADLLAAAHADFTAANAPAAV